MEKLVEHLSLHQLRLHIINKYFQVYKDYSVMESMDLDSDDITLDFVSCTICGAKF